MPTTRLRCNRCGKSVSTEVDAGTIVRAWIECPECIDAAASEVDRLRSENEALRAQLATLRDGMEPGGHVTNDHLREAGITR